MDRRLDGWVGGWMHEWMDGWVDNRYILIYIPTEIDLDGEDSIHTYSSQLCSLRRQKKKKKKWTPGTHEHPEGPDLGFKHHSPIKGTRIFWRNG